jgi:hypothetical protein
MRQVWCVHLSQETSYADCILFGAHHILEGLGLNLGPEAGYPNNFIDSLIL